MKNNNNSIVNDLKKLVNNYMPENNSREFSKIIDDEVSIGTTVPAVPSDNRQINYVIPDGINHRVLVDKTISYCGKILEERQFYKLLLDLSQMLLFAGESSFALELADDLLSRTGTDNSYLIISGEAALLISRVYWSQAYWDDCSTYISEACRYFDAAESKPGKAKCENMLATLYGEKGEFERAKEHLENALGFLKEDDDLLSHAMVLANLGIINTIQGDYEKAVWNYKNSFEKFKILNDTHRLARVSHNIGMLYTKMEKYDAALDEFNKCITLSLDNDYLSNCAVAYIGKAYIYSKMKNCALAEAYTDKALEIACKINDTLSIADIYKIKGMVQSDLENFQLSEELFENSLRLNQDTESKLNEAESSEEMAKLLRKTERDEEAKNYIDKAVGYFKNVKPGDAGTGLSPQHSV